MRFFVVAACIALGVPNLAYACSCAAGKIEQVIAGSSIVFEGDVISTELLPAGDRQSTFLVRAAYKGVQAGQRVVVRSRDPDGKSCDLVAITPGRWLLVVHALAQGEVWIGRCDAYSHRFRPEHPSATVKRVRQLFHAARAGAATDKPEPPPSP